LIHNYVGSEGLTKVMQQTVSIVSADDATNRTRSISVAEDF